MSMMFQDIVFGGRLCVMFRDIVVGGRLCVMFRGIAGGSWLCVMAWFGVWKDRLALCGIVRMNFGQ